MVVGTAGCFDGLHTGHIRLLEAARAIGDALWVFVAPDSHVAVKGEGRPVLTQEERAELVGALRCVDRVILYDRPIQEVLPEFELDLYVKGADREGEDIPEIQVVKCAVYSEDFPVHTSDFLP